MRDAQTDITLSIVIPIYNEASSIEACLKEIKSVLLEMDLSYEVIVVDDGSTDRSWKALQSLSKEGENAQILRAIRFSRNFGKEAAIAAGLELSRGDGVIVMDSDLQHPPQLIPEMVRLWQGSEVDVVEAVKKRRGKESFLYRMSTKLFYAIFSKLSGFPMHNQTDYKLMDRRVVNAWLKMCEHNLFFRGMTAWLGFKHAQIPFDVPERKDGQSKWPLVCSMRLSLSAVSAFSSFPLQLVTLMGALFLLFAFALGADALFLKLTGRALDGFTTIILLLLITGSLLMISLGIIGMYIARIYDETKQRPRYIRDEILEAASLRSHARYKAANYMSLGVTEFDRTSRTSHE